MWFLVWMQFTVSTGDFEYYQIGMYGSEKDCQVQLTKAQVMVTNSNSAVHCFEVDRN